MKRTKVIDFTIKKYGKYACKRAYSLQYYGEDDIEIIDDIFGKRYCRKQAEMIVDRLVKAYEVINFEDYEQETDVKIFVSEQKPVGCGTILCNIKSDRARYRRSYFTCDSDRRIIQYFKWQFQFRDQLINLGYKF